jgi:hypothetical protein
MAVNKVVYNGQTLIDLTQDTVTEDTMLSGITAHDKSGNKTTGTIPRKSSAEYIPRAGGHKISAGQYLSGDQIIPGDENFIAANIAGTKTIWGVTGTFSNDATVMPTEVLNGKTYYAQGYQRKGTMPNKGSITGYITHKDTPFVIPAGYHDGSGTVGLTSQDIANLIPQNIAQHVTILGVQGEMTGTEAVNAQEKTVTPTTEEQIITPDRSNGYNFLSQVLVHKIPYVEADNEFGTTVTIG